MAEVRSQWKASKKGEVEVNQACWKCLAKCHPGSTSANPTGTSYRVVTYTEQEGEQEGDLGSDLENETGE
jgi:hypothetical protein